MTFTHMRHTIRSRKSVERVFGIANHLLTEVNHDYPSKRNSPIYKIAALTLCLTSSRMDNRFPLFLKIALRTRQPLLPDGRLPVPESGHSRACLQLNIATTKELYKLYRFMLEGVDRFGIDIYRVGWISIVATRNLG